MQKYAAIAWIVFTGLPVVVAQHREVLEYEVAFENKKAGINLSGTFTKPKKDGSFPAALLINGAGPVNRENDYVSPGMFSAIAERLSNHGIAVLRYDKRGVGKSQGVYKDATLLDFADDATAGIAYLRSRKDIKAGSIGLIGHSEGALVASIVASRSKDVSFLILLASPGRKLEELIIDSRAADYRDLGYDEDSINETLKYKRRLDELVKSGNSDSATMQEAKALIPKVFLTDEIDSRVNELFSPPYRFVLTHDPVKVLQQVRCPTLALFAGRDRIVTPKSELPIVEAALKSNGNKDATSKTFPSLDHMFQKMNPNAPTNARKLENAVDSTFLDTIQQWINKRTSETELKGKFQEKEKKKEKGSG